VISRRLLSALAGLCFILSSRLVAQDASAALLAADRAAAQLSGDSGFTAALLRNAAPDPMLLWPGAPVTGGLDDVRKLLDVLPGGDSLRLTWQPQGLELAQDSTLGITWGVAAVSLGSSNAAPRIGRYTTAWRHDEGRWSIAALLLTGLPPVVAGTLPPGLPLTRSPARVSGKSAPFIEADLAFARLARERGAEVAFRRWAAPEAFTLGGGGLITRGPQAIGSAVAGPATWRWHPVAAGASQSGDLGWTAGEAVIVPRDGKPDYGKYLTVWIRRNGGAIRFLTDGGSARPPTTP
jgi:hypothetical protein